jgi:cell division protein FtsL
VGPREAPRDTFALGSRALALVRGLPDHSLIDRLVRGRAWIPVLGVLLAGIVAMQVEILKLGTSMGRAMERSSRLQNQNESLRASVASLADDQRIERLAAGMGMVMPAPYSLVFLHAHSSADVGRAATRIQPPNGTAFASQLAAQAAAAAALMPPPPPATTGTGGERANLNRAERR